MNQSLKINFLYGFVLLFLLVTWSCKSSVQSSNKAAVAVPSSAASVSSFNIANLMEKVDYETVKNMEMFKKAVEEAGNEQAVVAEILQDPSISGIDLAQDAYLFMNGNEKNAGGGFVLNLANAADFEAVVQKGNLGTITKDSGINLVKSNNGELVAWNEEIAFVGSGYAEVSSADIVALIFSGDVNKSVVNNPSYKKLMTSDHDINTWVNFNPFLKEMPPMAKMQASMLGIGEDDLTDNFMFGYWDFKDGEMEGKMAYDVKDGLVKDFSAFFKKKIGTDFSNKIPGDYLGAAGAMSLDLKGINQVLKEKGMQEMANAQVESMDFSLDEIANGLGGDMVLAFYPKAHDGVSEVVMAMTFTDEALAQKMVDFGLKVGAFSSAGDGLYKMPNTGKKMRKSMTMGRKNGTAEGGSDGWFLVKDDLMYLTSSESFAKQIQSGKFNKAARIQDVSEALNSNIVGGFFNFEAMQSLVKDFDSAKFNSMTFSSSRENTRMSLKTNEKNENSLKTLFVSLEEQFKKENIEL